jgi:hypothetical protein
MIKMTMIIIIIIEILEVYYSDIAFSFGYGPARIITREGRVTKSFLFPEPCDYSRA